MSCCSCTSLNVQKILRLHDPSSSLGTRICINTRIAPLRIARILYCSVFPPKPICPRMPTCTGVDIGYPFSVPPWTHTNIITTSTVHYLIQSHAQSISPHASLIVPTAPPPSHCTPYTFPHHQQYPPHNALLCIFYLPHAIVT